MIVLSSSGFLDRDDSLLNTKTKKRKRNEWESDTSENEFDESDYVDDGDDDDVIEIKKTTAGDRKRRVSQLSLRGVFFFLIEYCFQIRCHVLVGAIFGQIGFEQECFDC